MSVYNFEGVDGAKLHALLTTFKVILFKKLLGAADHWTTQVAAVETITTKGDKVNVKAVERSAGVHEWVDERQKALLAHFDYEINVKRWANAISFDLDKLDDESENVGAYVPVIREMGDDFQEHKHQLVVDLVNNGFTAAKGLAPDGQFFFDTDHPLIDGTTQSNKGTAAFAAGSLYAALKDMTKFKRPNGLFANVRATHGLFPEALRSTVDSVIGKQFEANGSDNKLYKRIEPIFDPRLDAVSETAWFLFDFSKEAKPIRMAKRREVTQDMDISEKFEKNRCSWGASARYNGGFGIWQTAWGSTGLA